MGRVYPIATDLEIGVGYCLAQTADDQSRHGERATEKSSARGRNLIAMAL